MLKEEYNKMLDWLEDFISSHQELTENDLEKYLWDNFDHIWTEANPEYELLFDFSHYWKEFYTLFFKKEKYIIENNVLIRPCLKDIKKADDIPNSVKEIGDYAFEACEYLRSITIPNNVTNIAEGAFFNCSDLNSITINNNTLKHIGDLAFYDDRGGNSVSDIYFKGTKAEWDKINKSDNKYLFNMSYGLVTKIHCSDGCLYSI